MDERVGVVIMTRDRCQELMRTLAHLRRLPERPPVVVVDNGSCDGTVEAVRSLHGWVRLVPQPRDVGAVARNIGVRLLSTPYVAFCDDDTWWDPGSLTAAADALDACPELAVVTGRILVEPGGREDPIVVELRESPVQGAPGLPGPALASFLAGASMVRREAFLGCGGFEPRLWLGGEEELLAADLAAAGWELCYLPAATVHHHPSPHREPTLRRRVGVRNTLWFTWLRRPVAAALRRTVVVLRGAPHDRTTALACWDALRGLPWVVRSRRVLPPHAERRFLAVEHQQATSTARRYVG
ncbi:MAG TPA: glycosyltransferase [Actinomycetales bacterium]|nr:glycosyltransferase [Actinomycetales bacterium]